MKNAKSNKHTAYRLHSYKAKVDAVHIDKAFSLLLAKDDLQNTMKGNFQLFASHRSETESLMPGPDRLRYIYMKV